MVRSQPITETVFVVVDIETTGSLPLKDAITEIGAIKVKNGEIIDRFSALVNPQQDIPPFIQHLTGITPDMVADAPLINEVMPLFWDFLGSDVFVGHNVSFDFRFLSQQTKALIGSPLENPQLCTLRLARKLLPHLRKRNLDAVSGYFDIEIENRHRALGDAEATALVLIEFLKTLEEDGITTMAKLMHFHQKGGKRYGDMKIPFPEERLSQMPQNPGVYFMRDQKGEILYIGKAKNLRKRLQSYYSNVLRLPRKVQELIPQVFDIETRILGSELEALLEEAHLIKQHQPYYNRQIKRYRHFPFLKVSVGEPYSKLTVTTDIAADQALYFGPYVTQKQITPMAETLSHVFQLRTCTDPDFKKHQKKKQACLAYDLGRCTAPCIGAVSIAGYQAQVAEAVSFLEGDIAPLTDAMVAKREAYAEAMAFEQARQVQDRLLSLLKLQANTAFLAQAIHQNHALIVLPDRDPGRFLLLYVLKGRPFEKQVFDPSTDSIEAIVDRVETLQRLLQAPIDEKRETIAQGELEEVRILSQWLKHPIDDPRIQIWPLTADLSVINQGIHHYFAQANNVKNDPQWAQDDTVMME